MRNESVFGLLEFDCDILGDVICILKTKDHEVSIYVSIL